MEKDRGEEETKEKIDGAGSERMKNKARNEREKDIEVKSKDEGDWISSVAHEAEDAVQ